MAASGSVTSDFQLQYQVAEADLGLLQHLLPAVNYYHKALHLGCCSSPTTTSESDNKLSNIVFRAIVDIVFQIGYFKTLY